ncbi:hypothetical protein [Polaromonas sp.]|uniref:cytochrome b n=1 Tax=Polaromonas sp. TaxID=1869339 RepID=UPI0017A7067E|nr:hypothetical protein [Polaromonas sp.]NML86530.1 hypothetical protein [Polaromonas sp.]
MKLLNTKDHYGWVSIALHWLTLPLLVAVCACILLGDIFPNGNCARAALRTWHFMPGLTVVALGWVRLTAKLISPVPIVVPPIARRQERGLGIPHADTIYG